jgi:hypothetical protein
MLYERGREGEREEGRKGIVFEIVFVQNGCPKWVSKFGVQKFKKKLKKKFKKSSKKSFKKSSKKSSKKSLKNNY